MAANILTPLTIWGDFKIDEKPQADLIGEKRHGDVIVSKVYIDGQKTANGRVRVYGEIARGAQLAIMPAVLVVKDMETGDGDNLGVELAKRGYLALTIDVAGITDYQSTACTIYPEEMSYANYETAKETLYQIKKGVKNTCWYEWGVAVRYALEYLHNQPCVNKIGGIGVKSGAILLWQLASTEKKLSASVAVMNAGWNAYKGVFKFSEEDLEMTDDKMKYIAGIEPQTYASGVNAPLLTLCTTNSGEYDCDRVNDTVMRIPTQVYRAIDYSVNRVNVIDSAGFRNMLLFFDEFLMRGEKENKHLPLSPEIKCEIIDGKLRFEATVGEYDLSKIGIYIAEGSVNPCFRSWKRFVPKKVADGKYELYYSPYHKSKIVTAYASVRYDMGFTLCSSIIAKKFAETEVETGNKDNIIYSGRDVNGASVFAEIPQNTFKCLHNVVSEGVCEKSGPMGIDGIYAKNGLITFKVNAEKDKPSDGAILMLDVYAKEDDELTVTLSQNYFGNRVDYACRIPVKGGRAWHNVKLEMNRFKTQDGKIIKTFKDVNAISFKLNGVYLINNMLWV